MQKQTIDALKTLVLSDCPRQHLATNLRAFVDDIGRELGKRDITWRVAQEEVMVTLMCDGKVTVSWGSSERSVMSAVVAVNLYKAAVDFAAALETTIARMEDV